MRLAVLIYIHCYLLTGLVGLRKGIEKLIARQQIGCLPETP